MIAPGRFLLFPKRKKLGVGPGRMNIYLIAGIELEISIP
jgi:hypothetical protein